MLTDAKENLFVRGARGTKGRRAHLLGGFRTYQVSCCLCVATEKGGVGGVREMGNKGSESGSRVASIKLN